MGRVTISALYSPFVSAIHPAHAAVDQRSAAWVERFGIGTLPQRQELAGQGFGTLAARMLPEADEAFVQVVADFMCWLCGVDDGYCEDDELGSDPGWLAGAFSRLLRVAQHPDSDVLRGDRLAAGLRDVRRRAEAYAPPSGVARWVDGLREYFLAVVWEAEHRRRRVVPGLGDYTLMRLYDGAVPAIWRLMETNPAHRLDADVRDARAVRAVTEMAQFVICWDNDLFSLHRESRTSRHRLNAVSVLAHERSLSAPAAVRECVAQRDRVLCRYLHLRDRLAAADGGPGLGTHLGMLDSFIRGGQDWSITTSRYTTPDAPAPLPAAFTDRPSDSSDEPLAIPAISWWWSL
ncbi:hypothetical protein AC230_20690 [Streptomyces caatingaensis]|uniref:Terpene synthase n=1 Tax=Streptomyces caatingaensis TaxID=1678637 RepID=A0A0K9XCP4_9ACTN|nr:hypothetical protein AC230_20690 [Streptomyces caatingaensis]